MEPPRAPEVPAPVRAVPRRHTGRTAAVALLGTVAALLAVVLVLTLTPWGNERVRRLVVSRANARLRGELAVGSLRGNLWRGATLRDVRLLDSARQPLFSARAVRLRYAVGAALRGRVVLESLQLDTPTVVLDRRPGARWNFQSLLTPSPASARGGRSALPVIENVTIRHGHFVYRRPWSPDTTIPRQRQREAVARALDPLARRLVVAVPGGYQRILDYRDIDAELPRVVLARGSPAAVHIASLRMIAEPYRPPAIVVRHLTATLLVNRDSLWWRGARMRLAASTVTGDGTIGFHRLGFHLALRGSPLVLGDLRWLDPRLPAAGGGTLRYAMRVHGDTAEYEVDDADLTYRGASLIGHLSLRRIAPKEGRARLALRDADVRIAALSTAALHDLLPRARVRAEGVLAGHLVARGEPRDLALQADVTFQDAAAGLSHVIARGGIGFGEEIRASHLRLDLRPLRLATVRRAGVAVPVGGTLTGHTTITGASRGAWMATGDITHVEDGARSRVVGRGRYDVGTRAFAADVAVRPLALASLARLAPAARLHGEVTGRVAAAGTARAATFTASLRARAGGTLTARGRLEPRGRRTRYDVAAVVDALDVHALSGAAPHTRLTGRLAARGVGTRPATARALLAADLGPSRYDTFAVDRLLARARVERGLLRLDTLLLAQRGARASAGGSVGLLGARSGTLRVALEVDSLGALRRWIGTADTGLVAASGSRRRARLERARADSARRAQAVRIERLALGLPEGVALAVDSLPPIRRDSLAGRLTGRAELRGNVRAIALRGRLTGSDIVARGSAARFIEVDVASDDVRSARAPLTVSVRADTVQTAGYAFDRVRGSAVWRERTLTAELDVRQDSLVRYAAAGQYARRGAGVHLLRLDSLRGTFDTLVWRLARPATVARAPGVVTLDSVVLRSSAGGLLFANGTLRDSGSTHLEVAADHVGVATVLAALQSDAAADGVLDAALRIDGTRARPQLAATATLRQGRYEGVRTPDVELRGHYAAQRLALGLTAVDSAGRRVAAGAASVPLDLSLAPAAGSRKRPGAITADLTLDTLAIAALPLRSRAVRDATGTLTAALRARGSWRTPAIGGHLALRDGGVVLTSTGMQVEHAVADFTLAGDTVRLDSLVASARGTVRATGIADVSDWRRPVIDARLLGTDVRIMDQQRGLVDADAEISVRGPLDALRVTGRGEMKRGFLALKQFRKDLLRVRAPGELEVFSVLDTSAARRDTLRTALSSRARRRVAIIADLALAVDRGNYYRNRPDASTGFFTRGSEELRAHLDQRTGDQWAVGFVRVGGGVVIFRTRPFEPRRGTLSFIPHTDAPGIIQEVAERPVWEPGRGWFPLQLLTGGTSKGPALGLESGTLFPIRGRELNGYLTLGRSHTSLLQQSGTTLAGSESWTGQLSGASGALARRQQSATALGVVLHDIGTGATKEFGLDLFSVSPADVPTELVLGKTGGVRGAQIEGGRFLSTTRFVGGELRLTTGIPGVRYREDFGTTYRLEAGIEPRYLLRVPRELGITHPTERTGVLAVFLTRMWDF